MSSVAQKLASGSALRALTFFSNVVVTFFMMPFVMHTLGDRMYGFWTLVGAFLGYYSLMTFGLSSAANRYMAGAIGANDEAECNKVFSTAVIMYLFLGAIVLVVTGIIAAMSHVICEDPKDAELFWKVITILGINIAVSFPVKPFYGALAATLRFDILSYPQFITLLLRTSLIVVVLIQGFSILAMALVTFISSIPELALIIYYARKNLPFLRVERKSFNRSTFKMLFSYSIYTFIGQIGQQLRFNIDAFVITAYISLVAVTHYNIAATLIRYFMGLILSLMSVFAPLFSRQHDANDMDALRRTFFFSTEGSFMSSLLLIFWFIFLL